METDTQLKQLSKLLEKYFPEVVVKELNTSALNSLAHTIQEHFSLKLCDDMRELLESNDVKYADVDTAIRIISNHVNQMAVMETREILTYKILPCPYGETCQKKPVEIVPQNEYMDKVLECPFYHREKDRRRIVVECSNEEEFLYKANYQKGGDVGENDGSKNFYESLFHPVFYKFFRCERKYCKGSYFCPFKHSEKEKELWDERFLQLTGKQREVHLKDKAYSMSIGSTNSLSSLEDHVKVALMEGGDI